MTYTPKRLVPIDAYNDEKGPVCYNNKGKCLFRSRIDFTPVCTFRNKYTGDILADDRPGPWCPVWYGEKRDNGVCEWSEDELTLGYFESGCGASNLDDPMQMGMKFCHKCGRKLEVKL